MSNIPEYPLTRKERYLATIAGSGTGIPDEPLTREEQYLAYIAENGTGGGGGAAGVSSFNGRSGAVKPKSGDYTAEDVGARPDTWTPEVGDVRGLDDALSKKQDELTGPQGNVVGFDADGNAITAQISGRNLYLNGTPEQTAKFIPESNTSIIYIKTSDILSDYVGQTICVSFDCRMEDATTGTLFIYAYQSSGISIDNIIGSFYINPTNKYKRFSFITTVKDWGDRGEWYSKGEIAIYNYSNPNLFKVKNFQITLGNVITDYSYAIDDLRMASALFAPEMHRNIFRGKNLGNAVTDAQVAAINSGTFEDLYVGDYWVINSVNWRIADMDYFYRCGDTDFTKHHLVIVPDVSLYNAQMNESNTAEGGYIGSEMRENNLTQAEATIASAFGELVLTHKDYLTNAVTNGYPSAGAWVNSTVELMNEIMVYGTHVYAPASDGTTIPNKYTTGKQQFALFALDPKKVNIRITYWLRDVVSSANFATVHTYGRADHDIASTSRGVRPYFCVGQ